MKPSFTGLLASALFAASSVSTAAPIRMIAEGVVQGGGTYPGVEFGDPWSLVVLFDPATMTGQVLIEDTQAIYTPLLSVRLALGPFLFEETSATGLEIANDFVDAGSPARDYMSIGALFVEGPSAAGSVFLSQGYLGGGPLTSLALPMHAAAYNSFFSGTSFFIAFSAGAGVANGVTTNVRFAPVLVPEPDALALLLSGAIGLLLVRLRTSSGRDF
jgi:hypothetical protein